MTDREVAIVATFMVHASFFLRKDVRVEVFFPLITLELLFFLTTKQFIMFWRKWQHPRVHPLSGWACSGTQSVFGVSCSWPRFGILTVKFLLSKFFLTSNQAHFSGSQCTFNRLIIPDRQKHSGNPWHSCTVTFDTVKKNTLSHFLLI